MIITIDGPTASGKSTLAYMLARDFNLTYLNTGLLYRAFAYCLVHERGYTQERFLSPAQDDIAFVRDSGLIVYSYNSIDGARIYYKGVFITDLLKLPHVDRWASVASAQSEIRTALLEFQRNLAQRGDVIADGRDCGSVVFPMAEHKFFVTAEPETRARRWRLDQERRGVVLTFEEALCALVERDVRDSTRTHAPLRVPPDAHMIDNSRLSLDETVDYIKTIIRVSIGQ